jgi:hypothetical protein
MDQMSFLQLIAEEIAFVGPLSKTHRCGGLPLNGGPPMNFQHLFMAAPLALVLHGSGEANAGKIVEGAGTVACVSDKWDVKEPEKGHKLIDYGGRCVFIPNDTAAEKATQECAGNFEYMPDGSYEANGTCTHTFKSGDKRFHKWEEGTHIRERGRFTITGGTGKLEGVRGSGTYALDELTDTLQGGTYTEKVELP